MPTFQDDTDYHEFLRLRGLLVEAGVLLVHAYCLSSYRNYVGGPVMTDWVTTARLLSHFACPNDYRQYVESGRDETPISPFERARVGLVLGSEAFVKRIREMSKTMQKARGVSGPRALRRTEPVPTRELVEAVVNQEFPELPGYRRLPLTGYLLGRLTLLKANEIAELLQRGPTAVTMARRRLETRLAQDEQWERRYRRPRSSCETFWV